MAFIHGEVIVFLLIIFSDGSKANLIKNDGSAILKACYIGQLTKEEIQTPYNLQYCDHVIFDITDLKNIAYGRSVTGHFDNKTTNFVNELELTRQKNPNFKIIGKIVIKDSKALILVWQTLALIEEYDLNGISIDFPSHYDHDEWIRHKYAFEIYHKKKILLTLFWSHCNYIDENYIKIMHAAEIDYIYIVCDSEHDVSSQNLETAQIDETISLLIKRNVNKSRIFYGIDFCAKQYNIENKTKNTIKYDEVCELFTTKYKKEDIKFNETMQINEWISVESDNNGRIQRILFNSPETVANRVIKAKNLDLVGIMAYRLECDNTQPICLDKVGRCQLFNALRKTEENEPFDYPDDNYESGGKENALSWFIISSIFFLWIIFS